MQIRTIEFGTQKAKISLCSKSEKREFRLGGRIVHTLAGPFAYLNEIKLKHAGRLMVSERLERSSASMGGDDLG